MRQRLLGWAGTCTARGWRAAGAWRFQMPTLGILTKGGGGRRGIGLCPMTEAIGDGRRRHMEPSLHMEREGAGASSGGKLESEDLPTSRLLRMGGNWIWCG